MRAMRAETFRGCTGLKLVDLPKPSVVEGPVLLRVAAALLHSITRSYPAISTFFPYESIFPNHRGGCSRVGFASHARAQQLSPQVEQRVQSLEWTDLPGILARIHAPEFPPRNFDVITYGAKGDGVTDSLPAIRTAMEKCHSTGGGHVVVPAGTYLLNGPVYLKSNVDLHLERGCTLVFSGKPQHYLPVVLTQWEGMILYNYSPLIYARGEENIAVTGEGVIDGNARLVFHGWAMGISNLQEKAQSRSREMNANGTPIADRIFGEGSFLRPSMIQPYECRNVLIQGVTVKDSPFWVIHPTFCTDVIVSRGYGGQSHDQQ
jgi:polygalacturonase